MGHPKPLKVIIKKCPKLLRIYGMWLGFEPVLHDSMRTAYHLQFHHYTIEREIHCILNVLTKIT